MTNKKNSGFDVESTMDRAELYIQENKKSLSIIGVVALLLLGGYFAYNQFIVKPQEQNAEKQMFMAEYYFKNDSLDKAIKGDGNFPGFEEIISNYGSSKSANLAHYYLGVSFLRKGQFDDAIAALSKYDAEDDITGAIAFGCIGDAYLEKGDKSEALKFYKKATDYDNNQFTAPVYMMKQALVYELNNDYKSAVDLYNTIKRDYPNSTEARQVATYLSRAEAHIN
ncbi:MAG: tetratricopeptide repeat protein [Bacteroidetes bacterium]|jgi:predicted negative regulator of RcsB-dependent stress response|nr:tetratricopeptide repeat protein [Bacteroidota bacterium]